MFLSVVSCVDWIRSLYEITSTTRLSFYPSSALYKQLHSLQCAYLYASTIAPRQLLLPCSSTRHPWRNALFYLHPTMGKLNTNKNPTPVAEFIPCAYLRNETEKN